MRVSMLFLGVLVAGGAIQPARAADPLAPDSKAIAAYRAYLDTLPKDESVSVTKAIGAYLKDIAPLDQNTRNHAFLLFLDFSWDVCSDLEEGLWKLFSDTQSSHGYAAADDAIEQQAGILEFVRHGIETHDTSEGGYWVRPIPRVIYGFFAPHVSKSIREFLQLRNREIEEGYCYDASLAITFRRLAERLADWEQYLLDYPNSIVREDVVELRNMYLGMLLQGTDNSGVPLDSTSPDANMKELYSQLVQRFPDSVSGRIIASHTRWLESHGWKMDSEGYANATELLKPLRSEHTDTWPAVQLTFRVLRYARSPEDEGQGTDKP